MYIEKSIKGTITMELFQSELELIKEYLRKEMPEADIDSPVIERKQLNYGAEGIKCFGKSFVSSIKLDEVLKGNLYYFISDDNQYCELGVRP